MLHLIFQLPCDPSVFQRITLGDDVIFFEKSLFKLYQGSTLTEELTILSQQPVSLYVLEDDILCRGLSPKQLMVGIKVIDYAQMVGLTEKNKVIQTWN